MTRKQLVGGGRFGYAAHVVMKRDQTGRVVLNRDLHHFLLSIRKRATIWRENRSDGFLLPSGPDVLKAAAIIRHHEMGNQLERAYLTTSLSKLKARCLERIGPATLEDIPTLLTEWESFAGELTDWLIEVLGTSLNAAHWKAFALAAVELK